MKARIIHLLTKSLWVPVGTVCLSAIIMYIAKCGEILDQLRNRRFGAQKIAECIRKAAEYRI